MPYQDILRDSGFFKTIISFSGCHCQCQSRNFFLYAHSQLVLFLISLDLILSIYVNKILGQFELQRDETLS